MHKLNKIVSGVTTIVASLALATNVYAAGATVSANDKKVSGHWKKGSGPRSVE